MSTNIKITFNKKLEEKRAFLVCFTASKNTFYIY